MFFSGVYLVKPLYGTVYYTVWSDVLLTQLLPYLFISFNVWGDKKYISNRSFAIAFYFKYLISKPLKLTFLAHIQCIELHVQIEMYSK